MPASRASVIIFVASSGLVANSTSSENPRYRAPVCIVGPVFRQVQPPVYQRVPLRRRLRQIHCHLRVFDSSRGSGVLPLHPDSASALLHVAGLVEHQRPYQRKHADQTRSTAVGLTGLRPRRSGCDPRVPDQINDRLRDGGQEPRTPCLTTQPRGPKHAWAVTTSLCCRFRLLDVDVDRLVGDGGYQIVAGSGDTGVGA